MALCCILLRAVSSLVSLPVRASILIRSYQPELFYHTEDSLPLPQRRNPSHHLHCCSYQELWHDLVTWAMHQNFQTTDLLSQEFPLVSCSLSSPSCHRLFVVARGKELHLSHSLLLYRSAASLTLVSICVQKHLIYEHGLQKSQAFRTSALHTALITAPVISSARS